MMSASRDRSRQSLRPRLVEEEQAPPQRRVVSRFFLLLVVFVVPLVACVVAAARTGEGHTIVTAVQRFLLFYAGVFALVALTAAVGAGLLATDRIVMSAGRRVALQAVHRAISLLALAALTTHIVLEIMAHKAQTIDAFVPFLAHGRTFYIGLGAIASDLVVLIAATGIVRRRFAARAPWSWRVLHAAAYLAWPLAIVHGLLAGRHAKPYVDWSYGACVAAVILALLVRMAATAQARSAAGRRSTAVDRAWPASQHEGRELR
jgi:DMSO/TMAO reductase YedYZ heme-binding membrane subunit